MDKRDDVVTHKVFIVEDHAAIRQGYTLLLTRTGNLRVCGEAASAEEALVKISELTPDIVLIDFSLPGMSGLELVQQLHQQQPNLPTVVISGHNENVFASSVVAAGAASYIVKEQAPARLVETIYQVLQHRPTT